MEIRRRYNISKFKKGDLLALNLKYDTKYNRLKIELIDVDSIYNDFNVTPCFDIFNYTSLEVSINLYFESQKQITDLEYKLYESMINKIDKHNIKLEKDLVNLKNNIKRTKKNIDDFKKISLKNLDRLEKLKRISGDE